MLESKDDKIKPVKITKSKDEVSETTNENEVIIEKTIKELDSQEVITATDVSEVIDKDKASEDAKALIVEEIVDIEEVVKGNHLLELPEGVYIVAGVFKIYENADKFSDELFLKGYHEALVGYVSEKGFYYTVIYRSESVANLKSKLLRERKKRGMDKIWIKMIKVNKQ